MTPTKTPPMFSRADRVTVPVFALAVQVALPDPVPDPVTVTHEAFDDVVQLQPVVVVTVMVPVPPFGDGVTPVGETEMLHDVPASVIVNDLPAIVRVAVLENEPVFAVAL